MKDLTDPLWIKLKGLLFLFAGVLSAGALLVEAPAFRVAVLLVISLWCFCRAYYFAFYVIEKYVDPGYRFSGVWSAAMYLAGRRRERRFPSDSHRPGKGLA